MRSFVSLRSSVLSTRDAMVLILIFCRFAEKSTLKEKESVELMSRPGGCFFRILYFAHARDCSCRFSSTSWMDVAAWISCRDESQPLTPLYAKHAVGSYFVGEELVVQDILEKQENGTSER